jgi:tetratricopeptide (TPR) repeat protein
MTSLDLPHPAPTRASGLPKALLTDLSITPIAETIRQLTSDGRSGDLLVRVGKLAKMVFFDRGRIVFAASNARKDRFGDALMHLGVISKPQFTQASALMAKTKVRFGDALIAAGILDAAGVGRAVKVWAESIVISLFDLKSGTAFFEARRCVIPAGFAVQLSSARILRAGIASMTNADVILASLGDLDRTIVSTGTPEFSIDSESAAILQSTQEAVTIRSLLSRAESPRASARLRAVYALLCCGVLAEVGEEPELIEEPPEPRAEDSVRTEVEKELARSQALDPKTWLDLSMSAPREKIVQALEQRMERYQALRTVAANDGELGTDVELLLSRASSSLRLTRRALASKHHSAQAAPPAAPAPARPAPEPSAAKPVVSAGSDAPAPAAPQKATMELEHLRMEADIRMSVSDFANAARIYAQLVELRPNDTEYRIRLAVAMARTPSLARQAEAQFLEAIRLEPDNAEFHFKLGLYYKALKVHSRCITELRAAVQLDPRHKKAQAELDALAPNTSGLAGLKRLLG